MTVELATRRPSVPYRRCAVCGIRVLNDETTDYRRCEMHRGDGSEVLPFVSVMMGPHLTVRRLGAVNGAISLG